MKGPKDRYRNTRNPRGALSVGCSPCCSWAVHCHLSDMWVLASEFEDSQNGWFPLGSAEEKPSPKGSQAKDKAIHVRNVMPSLRRASCGLSLPPHCGGGVGHRGPEDLGSSDGSNHSSLAQSESTLNPFSHGAKRMAFYFQVLCATEIRHPALQTNVEHVEPTKPPDLL